MSMDLKVDFPEKILMPVPEKGLTPLAMKKLPAGAIAPSSWLKKQLEIALKGLPGKLWKFGEFLRETNGWLHPEKIFYGSWTNKDRPWEEQAYYIRTLVLLAIHTKDEESLLHVEKYMKAMLASQEEDGWFGPQNLKYSHSEDPEEKWTLHDVWPHMVMNEAILTWVEYTGEKEYIEMLRKFCHFCLNADPEKFLPEGGVTGKGFTWLSHIQYPRACDIIPGLYRIYDLTGDEKVLDLVHKFYKKWYGQVSEFMNIHTVNFAQQFAYRTYYSRLVHEKWLEDSAHYWYDQHMSVWGTLPRGSFCADENIRKGCTDPRYGMESCTFSEFTRSFMNLGEMKMEPCWADRTEDILFNHYPASHTKDMAKVHYITASNQVMLDDYLYHNVANKAHMFAYTDVMDRCCLHNAGLPWMLYTSYLLTRVHNGGLCAYLHGGYTASATAGKEDTPIKVTSQTDYPFREKITFTLEMEKAVSFPFYIRIPKWCLKPEFSINGCKIEAAENSNGKFILLEKVWQNGDKVEVRFPSEIKVSENIRNGGITIDKGPFSYSLQIPEKENTVISSSEADNPKKEQWDEKNDMEGNIWLELLPEAPWNYGLLPEEGFTFEECPLPEEYPFYWATPPMIIKAKGKKIPNWKLQDHMCAELQHSPIKSNEPVEELTLIPMGCARLRLTVFPVISDAPWAREWKEVPETTSVEDRPKIRL